MRELMYRFIGGVYLIGGSAAVIVAAVYGMRGAR